MIYLDNAATTAMAPQVITAMTQVMTDTYGNPSSIHGLGRKASQLLRQARQEVAKQLGTSPRQLIFTSGGSESNNMAIKGYALANQDKGKHLITTSIEHHSVLDTMAYLESRFGFEVTYLTPIEGNILPQQLAQALREDTILVSTMWANNETGDLLPIADFAALLKDHQAVFHVDAVQVMGKIPVQPDLIGIDLLSASAHKFHGPKGVGFLYSKPLQLDKLIHGGDQEEKRRASTENLPAVVGLATALTLANQKQADNLTHLQKLKTEFLKDLDGLPYYLNQQETGLPHIIPIGFEGADNGRLLTQLDLAGFAVSTGSACTAGAVAPSHVLASTYGPHSPRLKESIRISLSEDNTKEELSALAQTLTKLLG